MSARGRAARPCLGAAIAVEARKRRSRTVHALVRHVLLVAWHRGASRLGILAAVAAGCGAW
jgi:hypothetical protein